MLTHPRVGVAAAVFRARRREQRSVVIDASRILLVRRAKDPGRGLWCLPGGRQELGETVAQAAVREAREETGLAVEPAAHMPSFSVSDVLDADPATGALRHHYAVISVLTYAVWEGGRDASPPRPTPGDDVDAAAWVRIGRCPGGAAAGPASPAEDDWLRRGASLDAAAADGRLVAFVAETARLAAAQWRLRGYEVEGGDSGEGAAVR
jgi:8-oxo-dGTP diphosphatase